MYEASEIKPEKLSKLDKKEKKKLEKAAERMEKELREKSYTKISIFIMAIIDFCIFIGVILLTESIFAIILVYFYIMLITLIAVVPLMLEEYERVGREAPTLVRWFNSLLEKLLPFNRKTMKAGPSILIIFTYLLTIGGFLAIGVYIFADFLSQNPTIYSYLLDPGEGGDFGFFSFVTNSADDSLVPTILWYFIIFIPVIFCFLFLVAAVYYRNNVASKSLSIVMFAPLVVLLPLFLSASSIASPSIVISLIFIAAWIITLLIWYRFTKRTALISLSILFTQVLASFLILYDFIFIAVRDTSHYLSDPINTSAYYNLGFLALWFGILVLIPLVVKGCDLFLKGKLRILGVLFSIGIAVAFQAYFFNLFSSSVYNAYQPYGDMNAPEIFVGSGFFFFYLYLILIPLFFLFGYFQIGIARWLYRSFRAYGQKKTHTTFFRIVGSFLAILFIFGIIVAYYLVLYTQSDYQNMFAHTFSLFNGNLICYLTMDPAVVSSLIPLKSYGDLFMLTSLAITIGLFAYSSYRAAYNFALSYDKIEDPNIKRLGIFNFILFTSPSSAKTRLVFGISLVFVFLGVTTIYAFLKIHAFLFKDLINFNQIPPSLIIFSSIDALKLFISIIGMFVAIGIFFYIIFRRISRI